MRAIHKVLLIWPYLQREPVKDIRSQQMWVSKRFPLGIGYLASYLERELDVQVDLLDCVAENTVPRLESGMVRIGCSDDEIEDKIRSTSPDLVGVSQMFSYLEAPAKNIFSIAKSINPNIVNVWGGTHPTIAPNECLDFDEVDYLILGEGEAPFKRLIDTLNSNGDVTGMKSLAYRDSNGIKHINDEREWIQDLNTHVLPAREKVDFERYMGQVREANIVTSRGCPFACTFCSAPAFYQKRYNSRTPENVVDEIEFLSKEHGVEKFIFQDENTTFDMARVEGIADEIIRRKLKISWYSEAGTLIARLNPQLIEKMARSGVMAINLPVESGDPAMLKEMAKPLKLTKVKPVVDACRENGVRARSFLLLGMPGETRQQMEKTRDFAREVGFDWNYLSLLQPIPGTEVYEKMKAEGTEFKIDEVQRFVSAPLHHPELTGDELLSLRHEFNLDLNFTNNFNLTRGNLAVALVDFEDVATRYPNVAHIHHFLGLARYKNRDLGGAKTAFAAAIKAAREHLEHNETSLNSYDWVSELSAHILQRNSSQTGYLDKVAEARLNYSYGHIDDRTDQSNDVVRMTYNVATLEEMQGNSLG